MVMKRLRYSNTNRKVIFLIVTLIHHVPLKISTFSFLSRYMVIPPGFISGKRSFIKSPSSGDFSTHFSPFGRSNRQYFLPCWYINVMEKQIQLSFKLVKNFHWRFLHEETNGETNKQTNKNQILNLYFKIFVEKNVVLNGVSQFPQYLYSTFLCKLNYLYWIYFIYNHFPRHVFLSTQLLGKEGETDLIMNVDFNKSGVLNPL